MAFGATPAAALVTYDFSVQGLDFFQFVDDGNGGFQQEYAATYNVGFRVETTLPITLDDFYPASSCTFDFVAGTDLFSCGATQEFRPLAFGANADFIGLQFVTSGGGGGSFFFFPDGAFTANGTYNVLADPGNGAGNAGPGVLTVSGIEAIPEPGSLAVLGLGLAGFERLRRRRA